jgi:hypothetical protein
VTVVNGLEATGPDNNLEVEEKIKKEVIDLCGKFPIYSTL